MQEETNDGSASKNTQDMDEDVDSDSDEETLTLSPSQSTGSGSSCKATCCDHLNQSSPFQPTDKDTLESTTSKTQGKRRRSGTKTSHG